MQLQLENKDDQHYPTARLTLTTSHFARQNDKQKKILKKMLEKDLLQFCTNTSTTSVIAENRIHLAASLQELFHWAHAHLEMRSA